MRAVVGLLAPLGLLVATGCGGPTYRHVAERPLPADGGLECAGYLAWDQASIRDVFLVLNGSGRLSNAFVHPVFADTVRSRRVAYATFDKPGVRAPFGDPAAVRRDDATLARYTLGHGTACAKGALRWARETFGPSVRLHLRGHSEGTLVALYTYDELLDDDPDTARAVASIVLSGLAVEPFGDILEHQLAVMPAGARVRAALASCDDTVLVERMGISCAYVEDAKRRRSGRELFERLARRTDPSAAPPFYVFQGTDDWNTPAAPVRALEAWNASEGHLPIAFHFYEGGHGGNDAVRAEMVRLVSHLSE